MRQRDGEKVVDLWDASASIGWRLFGDVRAVREAKLSVCVDLFRSAF